MSDPTRDAKFAEFDAIGETKVRQNLAENLYGEKNKRYAESWLQCRDDERESKRSVESLALLSATEDQAASAREANELARAANDLASEANRRADTANNIAIASMVIAAISMIIAVIALFARGA